MPLIGIVYEYGEWRKESVSSHSGRENEKNYGKPTLTIKESAYSSIMGAM